MSSPARRCSAALITGAILFFAAFWKLRLYDPGTVFDASSLDIFTQLLPMWERAADSLRAGQVPLWNPYQACGQPFLAPLLYGVLYPLNAAWLVLDPAVVLELSTFLHLFLAWLFTFLFLRSCGLGPLASAVGGLGFPLSGIVLSEAVWYPPALYSAAWMPLGLLAVEKLIASRRRPWLVLLAVAVAMAVYGAWLQNVLYFLQAVALYAAVRLVAELRHPRGWRPALASAAMIGLGVALGLGLASAQLLPAFELSRLAIRGAGALPESVMFSVPEPPPLTLLRQAFDAQPGPPRLAYAGVMPLMLLPALLAMRPRPQVWALVAVGVFGVLAMSTRATPFWHVFAALPGVARFRIPWRVALIYAFAVSALAGFAFDALARAPSRNPRLLASCALFAALALLAVEMPTWSRACILAALALIGLCAWLTRPALRRPALAALAAAIAGELFLASWSQSLRPLHDRSLYAREKPLFDALREKAGLDRVFILAQPPAGLEVAAKMASANRFYSVTNYENLSLERQSFFFAGMDPGVRQLGFYPMLFDGSINLDASPANFAMLSQLGVRYFALMRAHAGHRRALEEDGWRPAFTPPGSAFDVYENPRPLPRAFVSSSIAVMDGAAAVKTVWRPRFDPFRLTVIEPPPGESLESVQSGAPIAPAAIIRYEATRVEIDAEAPQAGVLVLTDTDYPGWEATVDGEPARILTANYLFRAVRVGAGRHHVTFTYAPTSFRWGLAASGAAALVCAAVLLWPWIVRATGSRTVTDKHQLPPA